MTETDDPEVMLHVQVNISYKNKAYPTGVTVSRWNAMSPAERSEITAWAWEAAAQTDDGGIWTETPGAVQA